MISNTLNLYFDEKGPTKTIGQNKSDNYQFNWEGRSSDNVSVYLGVYVGIDQEVNEDIDRNYTKFELSIKNKYQHYKQITELKGKYLLGKGYSAFPKLPVRTLNIISDFLDFVSENNLYIHVVLPHKAQVLVQSRLQEWLYWIENRYTDTSIEQIFYVIVKYLVNEDVDHKFIKVLTDKEAKTQKILSILKNCFEEFNRKNKKVKNRYPQVEAYEQIITILKKYPAPYSMYEYNGFHYTFEQLTYGLELDLPTSTDERLDTHYYLYPDEDSPIEEFKKVSFLKVMEPVKSENTVGIRIADITATIIAKILVKLRMDLNRDTKNYDTIKELPMDWFDFSDFSLDIIKKIKKIIFTRQYQVMHGIYGDDALILESYIEFIAKFNNAQEIKGQKNTIQSSFRQYYLELMNANYEEMIRAKYLRKQLGLHSARQAHDSGLMKRW